MRFTMPPPLPPAKLLIPDAVEHASPAAQIVCSEVRPVTTLAAGFVTIDERVYRQILALCDA